MVKTIFLIFLLASNNVLAGINADVICKNLKSCTEWLMTKSAGTYVLGKLERKSLKIERELELGESDPDTLFNFILSQNDLARIKRENGNFEIVSLRELKDFTFPIIKDADLKPTFEISAMEFFFSNKVKVKNAMAIMKKLISKNGRVVQATDGTRVIVTDTGYQLLMLKNIALELNK